jgi:hypothetical protein
MPNPLNHESDVWKISMQTEFNGYEIILTVNSDIYIATSREKNGSSLGADQSKATCLKINPLPALTH